MKALFDHNVDRRFRRHLPGHQITTTREMGWDVLENGALLKAALDGGFEVFISIDKKIEYEQNLKKLPLPIVVIDAPTNALTSLRPFAPFILELLGTPLESLLYVIDANGTAHQVLAPR